MKIKKYFFPKIFLSLLLCCSFFLFSNSALADTQSFYSGTGTGWIDTYNYSPPVTTWEGKHSLTSGATGRAFYNQTDNYGIGLLQGTTYSYIIGRGFIPFNTSALPDSVNITSATVNLYVGQPAYMKAGSDTKRYLVLVQTTQASTDSLIVDDYDQCGTVTNPTEGSDHVFVTDGYTGWVTFTLNATGRSWINTTGYTKLGIRYGWDVENSAVTNADNEIYFRANGYTGTTYDPRLDLTYSTAVCGNGLVESGEVCDSNSQSCTVNGHAGTQACNGTCSGWETCSSAYLTNVINLKTGSSSLVTALGQWSPDLFKYFMSLNAPVVSLLFGGLLVFIFILLMLKFTDVNRIINSFRNIQIIKNKTKEEATHIKQDIIHYGQIFQAKHAIKHVSGRLNQGYIEGEILSSHSLKKIMVQSRDKLLKAHRKIIRYPNLLASGFRKKYKTKPLVASVHLDFRNKQ